MRIARQQAQSAVIRASEAFFQNASSPPWLVYGLLRFALGGVFAWSGITKLMDPQQFAVIIEAYGIMPDPWVLPTALCLCVIELLAGIGLIVDMQGALQLVTALLVLFMVILGYGLWMGLDVDCGCFGPHDPEAKAFHGLRPAIYRDGVMMAATVSLFWIRRRFGKGPIKLSTLYNRTIGKGDETG